MSDLRVQLEGSLERLEASADVLRRMRELIRAKRISRDDLVQVDRAFRTIFGTVPSTRRFATNPEVVSAFTRAAESMTAILVEARRLCRLLDVPLPRSVHELRPALEAHLPVHLSATLVGTPLENAGALVIPTMLGMAGVLAPASTPFTPFMLAAGLFLGLSVVHGTKRVVVSATRLRLGRRSWSLNDVVRVEVEGPSMMVAKIETRDGSTYEELLPGSIDPLIGALRAAGVSVSVQMRASP